jgi:choline-sulfatase
MARRGWRTLALGLGLLAGFGCNSQEPRQTFENLILVTLDTTRPDALGAYGNRRVRTPAIDELARRGHLFEQAYSHAPITLPSHGSILSGQLPTDHGVRNNIAYSFPAATPTLAGRLQAAGFATGAFVSSFILDRRFGLANGFDLYEDRIVHYEEKLAQHEIVTRRASVTTDRFVDWLGGQNGRFFAWVHFYDAHWPYEPPLPFRQAYADQPYLGEIASMDVQIARILTELERRGLREKTLVVLTADHGESFAEHGEQTHGFFCYSATTHVPLVLSHPIYGAAGRRFAHTVQSIDLVPSLLAALALPADATLPGRSLANREPRRVYSEAMIPFEDFYLAPVHGVRDGEHSFYLSSDKELYDLRADPGETKNLIAEKPELAREYEEWMRAQLAATKPARAETVHLDEESARLLASLGYVGSGGSFTARETDPFRFPSPRGSIQMYRELQRLKQFETTFPFKMIEGLRLLLREHRRQVVLHRDVGRLSTLAGNEEEALSHLEIAAKLRPEDPRLHVFRALGLYRFGKFDQSVDELRLALKLDPSHASAWYNLGLAEVARGRLDAALEALEKAVELNPRDILALNNLAYLYLTGKNDPDRAWTYITAAEAIHPSQPLVQANKRLISERRGRE